MKKKYKDETFIPIQKFYSRCCNVCAVISVAIMIVMVVRVFIDVDFKPSALLPFVIPAVLFGLVSILLSRKIKDNS